eukprot:6121937-Pleurochrysis_carterae.AAC.3
MYPGRRPYPYPTHMLKEATEFVQCRRVGGARKCALDAVYRTQRLSRGRKSAPTVATKITPSQRTKVPACLFSGIALVRPTLRVTLCQARRSATMRSRRVHVRIVHTQVVLASLQPSKGGRVVLAGEVPELNSQKGKEDSAEALGVAECTQEAKTSDVLCNEAQPVVARKARIAREQEGGQVRQHVVGNEEDAVVGKACSVVEDRKVVRQITWRGLFLRGLGNWRERSSMEGTRRQIHQPDVCAAHQRL